MEQITNKRKRGRPSAKQELNIEDVLDKAIQVFAEKGFEGAQMKQIAKRAGIASSLMNYHFGNKEALWKKAVKRLGKRLRHRFDEIDSYFKDVKGLALIKAFNRQFIYFSAANPEFYKIILHEMCFRTERTKWFINTILQPMNDRFEALWEEEHADKPITKTIPIPNLMITLISSANAFFLHAYQVEEMYGINPFDQEEIERHADIINDLFFGRFEGDKTVRG
ncbi:MAG: TetR/AcrR family transcriptional regulator [Chitinophagales bacterium]